MRLVQSDLKSSLRRVLMLLWQMDWLTDQRPYWLADWLTDSLTYSLNQLLTDPPTAFS
jgi:hypothetical protein